MLRSNLETGRRDSALELERLFRRDADAYGLQLVFRTPKRPPAPAGLWARRGTFHGELTRRDHARAKRRDDWVRTDPLAVANERETRELLCYGA